MAILNFSDVLRKAGIDPAQVKLIRHSLSDEGFRACYDCHMVQEYTAHQKPGFSKGYPYWAVFISGKGTYTRFFALYRVGDFVPDTPDKRPAGAPEAEKFLGDAAVFALTHLDALQEYENRMVIDWGSSARMWHQKGTTEKPVIAIESHKEPFIGYENVVLSYDELKEVVENRMDYALWQSALHAVKAVYLITDTKTGQQYVGSAYGEDGLLGRWQTYVETQHGDNKKMKDLLCTHPERYRYFQFSILQILPKTATQEEAISAENLWKSKLLTRKHGLNDN